MKIAIDTREQMPYHIFVRAILMGMLQSHTKVLQNVILKAIILVFGGPVYLTGYRNEPEDSFRRDRAGKLGTSRTQVYAKAHE